MMLIFEKCWHSYTKFLQIPPYKSFPKSIVILRLIRWRKVFPHTTFQIAYLFLYKILKNLIVSENFHSSWMKCFDTTKYGEISWSERCTMWFKHGSSSEYVQSILNQNWSWYLEEDLQNLIHRIFLDEKITLSSRALWTCCCFIEENLGSQT